MTCRACGHSIADNAIVCYKCGTPTAIPAPPPKLPVEAAPRSSIALPLLDLVIFVLALMAAHTRWPWPASAAAAVVATAVVHGAWRLSRG